MNLFKMVGVVMALLLYGLTGIWPGPSHSRPAATPATHLSHPPIPSFDAIPSTPDGEKVRFGHHLIVNTRELAKPFVGNDLSCSNCHLDAGRKIGAGTFVGVTHAYPRYRPRVGDVSSLEERIDECFERSLNGRALPADSPEMAALLAYMAWLSQDVPPAGTISWLGFPSLTPTRQPDTRNGQRLHMHLCAGCHGIDGHGTMVAPPLWGPRSYNIGSGMARMGKAAAFIQANMPFTRPGLLSDDEAYDVAAFMNSQLRPDYPPKAHDWPKGDKPDDIPY
jgi:thiosulfate dehydrogenase